MENIEYVCIDNDNGNIKNIGNITNIPYTIYKDKCVNNDGTVIRLNNWINPKYTYCVDKNGKKYFDKNTCDLLNMYQSIDIYQVSNCPTYQPVDLWYDDIYKKIVYIVLFWLIVLFMFFIWFFIISFIKN